MQEEQVKPDDKEKKKDNEDETNDDDDDDDDSSSSSLGIPLTVVPHDRLEESSSTTTATRKLECPPNGCQWEDNAIQETFAWAVKTHDSDEEHNNINFNPVWMIKTLGTKTPSSPPPTVESLSFVETWQPAHPLKLPMWAVDPISAVAVVADKDNHNK